MKKQREVRGVGRNPPSVLGGIHLGVLPPSGPEQPIPVFGLAPGRGRFTKSRCTVIPAGVTLAPGCVVSAPQVGLSPQLLRTWLGSEGGVSSARSREPLTHSSHPVFYVLLL